MPDWGRQQHYKTRSAPWIKSYRTELMPDHEDGKAYLALSLPARGLLGDLRRLAVECGNAIPCSIEWLAFRLHLPEDILAPLLDELLAGGRIQIAPNAISPAITNASILSSPPSLSPSQPLGRLSKAFSRSSALGENGREKTVDGRNGKAVLLHDLLPEGL